MRVQRTLSVRAGRLYRCRTRWTYLPIVRQMFYQHYVLWLPTPQSPIGSSTGREPFGANHLAMSQMLPSPLSIEVGEPQGLSANCVGGGQHPSHPTVGASNETEKATLTYENPMILPSPILTYEGRRPVRQKRAAGA